MYLEPTPARKVPLHFTLLPIIFSIALFPGLWGATAFAQETASAPKPAGIAKYSVDTDSSGPKIVRDGKVVAQLLTLSGSKPVVYPLIGPGGAAMTRSYPIAETKPGEKEDHIHHRSFWFTHGDVNGVDFWAEEGAEGKIIQTRSDVKVDATSAILETENDWLDGSGKRVCSDSRILVFHDMGKMRAIDFQIILKATDGDVNFGDTKEGSFGIRVAGTMKVDSKLGGKVTSSEGLINNDAWGKSAAWVDYYGPVEGKTVGVAIMNHPDSFGFPTRWHVRSYGLFAANPFGVHHFVGGEPTPGTTIPAGESLTFRYRVLLHEGTTEEAGIAEAWKAYVNE